MLRKLFLLVFIVIFLCLALPAAGTAQDFPDVCQQSENILRNCGFDNGPG